MAIRDESKPYILDMPAKIAARYGGNKQAIQQAAATGQVSPTEAVLAGMFIDKMRSAAALENVPNQTIYEKTFAPPQAQAPAGLGATLQAQAMPPMQPPAQPLAATPAQPPAMMADGGLASLPVDESMFPDEYAGGGIVAFSTAGSVSDPMFAPDTAQYDEFSSYQPLFPMAGEGNRRYKLKQLGYTNEQISKMPPAQQEFVLQNVQKAGAPSAAAAAQPPAATPAAQPPLKDFKDTDTGVDLTGLSALAKPPVVIPEGKSFKDFKKEMTDAGISEDPMADVRAKIASMAGESKLDREFSKNMALVQAGLATMAGTSQYALQNLGKGAMEGVSQYNKDLKDIKSAEKDLFKMQTELAKADDARARGDFKAWQDSTDRAKDMALKIRKLDIDEKVSNAQIKYYGRPGTYEELGQAAEKYPWLKDRGVGNTDVNRAKTALAAIESTLLGMKKDDPKRKQLEQRRAAILEQLTSMGGAGGAGGKPTLQWNDIP